MTAIAKQFGPVSTVERINSIDVLRGVALLGILLMNIVGFGLVSNAYDDPTVQGGAERWDLVVWVMNRMLVEDTMRAMFSMLFGVSMVLMTLRIEARGGGVEVADIYYRRTIWLVLMGMFHAYFLLWPGDILYAYGLFGLFLFPFRKTAATKLIIAVMLLSLVGWALNYYRYTNHMHDYELFKQAKSFGENAAIPANIKIGKESWEGLLMQMKPDAETIQQRVDDMHKGYFGVLKTLAPVNRMRQSTFNYDNNPWDVLPMMLLGMALYRLKVITAELSIKSYLLMILLGYGIGLSINYYEMMILLNGDFSVPALLNSGLAYPFGRIFVALGHIGLVMIFCKSNGMGFLKKALAAVGKMALTNYIMHSVICAVVFTGVGFSLFGKLQRHELYYVVISIWLFQLIVSPIWLQYFRFGPLEWGWRSLTYMHLQPFKIQDEQGVDAVVEKTR